jgi:hypothetical protein
MVQSWAMHTPLCQGGEAILAVALPLPQRYTLPAHEGATLPCVSHHDDDVIVAITVAICPKQRVEQGLKTLRVVLPLYVEAARLKGLSVWKL